MSGAVSASDRLSGERAGMGVGVEARPVTAWSSTGPVVSRWATLRSRFTNAPAVSGRRSGSRL
ncbi:MAG: hypothetical protein RLP09_00840 [Sandaracinaceae bacterium]